MNTCIVIGAGSFSMANIPYQESDFCIAVDGGYSYCKRLGIKPDLVIGDMDSLEEGLRKDLDQLEQSGAAEVIRLCPEKDDTDTLSALRAGLERGYRNYRIYGALGGRIDHVFANVQCLAFLKNNGAEGCILEDGIKMSVLKDESVSYSAGEEGYLSLFALGEKAEGVTIRGMKYPLDNAVVTNDYPIGISNEFIGKESSIEVKNGMLLMICLKK